MFRLLKKFFEKLKNAIKPSEQDVFYICSGGEVLPEKLSLEQELELTNELANGSENARSELIKRNLRLVVYTAQKFENTGVDTEDLISIGTIGLIKAVSSFNNEKNIKMATYASRCIENEILMFMRKKNRMKVEVSLDEPLNVDYDGNELLLQDILTTNENEVQDNLEYNEKRKIMYEAISDLKEKEKEIISLRYGLNNNEEMTQKEVADYLGISQSYISRLEKKIIKKLQVKLNK